jgi:hypothetical protein
VIAAHSLLKAQALEQGTEILEADVGIRRATKDLLQESLPHPLIIPPWSCWPMMRMEVEGGMETAAGVLREANRRIGWALALAKWGPYSGSRTGRRALGCRSRTGRRALGCRSRTGRRALGCRSRTGRRALLLHGLAGARRIFLARGWRGVAVLDGARLGLTGIW